MQNPPIITVENACKTFTGDRGEVQALDGFDMAVREGQFVSIVGPSGCGKSTLLWAMAALWPLTSGRITVNGREVLEPRREIGMVFQTSNLLPWRNLLQNIRFPFEIMREDPEHYRDRIDDLIEITALKGFEHHYPHELSGGMQQRASIVRAGTQEYMTSICPAPARYPLPPNLIFLKSSPKSNRPFSMTYRTMPRQPDESRRRAAAVTEYVELPPLANGSTHVY